MDTDRTATALTLLNVIEQRIRDLWTYRDWYHKHQGWIPAQQVEDRAEMRYLVGLLREARQRSEAAKVRVAAARGTNTYTPVGEYPIDYHDWQAS